MTKDDQRCHRRLHFRDQEREFWRREVRGIGCSVPKNAGRRQYLVCCRREHWENRAEGIAQKAAFLIGRIASLKKVDGSENERGQPRYQIQLSEYAELNLAGVWGRGRDKDLRNPVVYETLKQLGIELRGLKFKPMPHRPASRGNGTHDDRGGEKGFGRQLRRQTGRRRDHDPWLKSRP